MQNGWRTVGSSCSFNRLTRTPDSKAMHRSGLRFRFFNDHSCWSARPVILVVRPTLQLWSQMRLLLLLAILLSQAACAKKIEAFSPAFADDSVSAVSRYPNAVAPAKVGAHRGPAKSGAGYFY